MRATVNSRILQVIHIILIVVFFCSSANSKVIYVDDDAIGVNDGSSWENAYVYLQDALADANYSDKPVEIRVAQGTYKPDIGAGITFGDRKASFKLINGVTIAGSYAGIAANDPNVRDIELYETILSGDLNGDDAEVVYADLYDPNRAENSYHVVTGSGTNITAVLDGFIITSGVAISELDTSGGGGMYNYQGSPTITHCTFIGNEASFGGGMLNEEGSPILTNCTFSDNRAFIGGAMLNEESSPILTNCTFTNFGDMWNGYGSSVTLTNCTFSGNFGGVGSQESSVTLTNCTFSGNSGECVWNGCGSSAILTNCIFSGNYGNVIYLYYTGDDPNIVLILTNCTFSGNYGGVISCWDDLNSSPGPIPILTNCILWDNTPNEILQTSTITYSNIQGGWEGEGNFDEDPLFANPGYWADVNDPNVIVEPNDPNAIWVEGDYHLKSSVGRWDPNSQSWIIDDVHSPCIDGGDPNNPIGGELFPNGGRINMGAYGGTREASMSLETGGLLLPEVAFIYLNETEPTQSFKALLESYGCPTTLIKTKNVTATSLDSFDLVIVANNTYYMYAWSDPNAIAAIENSGKPIVGLGDGGYDFLGLLGLSIGSPYGGSSTFNAINVIDPNSSLFSTPYPIDIPQDGMLQLYTTETRNVSIYLWPDIPEILTVFGSQINDPGYFPLVMEQNRYLLWGFTESPEKMTDIGKRLFINTVIWMANAGWENEN